MEITQAASLHGVEIKRENWPEHAWLRFVCIPEANGEFATMLGDAYGNEYIFSRDDLMATNWEARRVNLIADSWQDFAEARA